VYQLVVLDIDGTILTSSHLLPDRVRQAMLDVRRAGVPISLASGKMLRSMVPLLQEMNITGPQITCNGTAIIDASTKSILAEWPLTHSQAFQVIEAVRACSPHVSIAWYTSDEIYSDRPYSYMDKMLQAYHEPASIQIESYEKLSSLPLKLLISDDPDKLEILRERTTPLVGDKVHIVRTSKDFLEYMNPDTNKGQALQFLANYMGIPCNEILAVGDGENDVQMIEVAGMGLAMANAHPKLQAVARNIIPSSDDEGLIEAFNQYIFQRANN
jgi:Cof subfamily protein (haloacid dehalogenase superfamily)